MQYSPKCKKAMKEIEEIMKKYELGGAVILHDGNLHLSEYMQHISPPYSCAKWEYPAPNVYGIRFRAKAEDYGGDKEKRNKAINDTVNLLIHLQNVSKMFYDNFSAAMSMLRKHIEIIEDKDDGHTTHIEQNN